MSVIIGSARIDENGHAHGGKAGDQTGREICTQEFYVSPKGWVVARLKKDKWANTCAKAMKTACNNPNIGYDQYQRDGLAPGREDVNTKKKVETDCSALVRRCIFNATGKDVGNICTITMEKALSKSGLFEPLKQYKTGMTLYTGDVLFTGKLGRPVSGHTVVVVKGKSRAPEKLRAAKPTLRKSDTGDEVRMLQRDLDHLGFVGKDGKNLSIDGDFGSNTEFALKSFQKGRTVKVGFPKKIEKLEVDGVYGKKSYKAMKEALK